MKNMGLCHRTHQRCEGVELQVYPMSGSKQTKLDAYIDKHLLTGHIQPSKSPMASLCFFIKKKDGKLCFIQDYRKLNAMTIKNWYPSPQEQSCPNTPGKMKNGIRSPSYPKVSMPWSVTMKSMTRRCWQLSEHWRNGDTLPKAPNTKSKSGPITETWSTS
jgi:hypothetical protein